jgi:hypothetical protein
MRKRALALKLIVGMILLSFVIPMKPSVSHAQAKLCCKKFCVHQIKNTPKSDCQGSQQKNSASGSIDCCQDSCKQKNFRDDHKAPTLNSLKTPIDPVNFKLIQGTQVCDWVAVQPLLWNDWEPPSNHRRPAPIYIVHSRLLI